MQERTGRFSPTLQLQIAFLLYVISILPCLAEQQFRILIPTAKAPVPGGPLVARSQQSYLEKEYLAERNTISVNSVLVTRKDTARQPGNPSAATVSVAPSPNKLRPAPEEVVLLGFDSSSQLIFEDYITDPWLIRGEFLDLPAEQVQAGRSRHQYFMSSRSLLLSLPSSKAIHSLDILRPEGRDSSLVFTPILRIEIR